MLGLVLAVLTMIAYSASVLMAAQPQTALPPLARTGAALLIAALVWLGVRVWPGWILWAMITVVMVGMGHPTTLIDERPLGRRRQLAALASLVLFVLTFVAEPMRIPMSTP